VVQTIPSSQLSHLNLSEPAKKPKPQVPPRTYSTPASDGSAAPPRPQNRPPPRNQAPVPQGKPNTTLVASPPGSAVAERYQSAPTPLSLPKKPPPAFPKPSQGNNPVDSQPKPALPLKPQPPPKLASAASTPTLQSPITLPKPSASDSPAKPKPKPPVPERTYRSKESTGD